MIALPSERKRAFNAFVAVVLIVLGLCVVLYPVVATQLNNIGQVHAAQEYARLEAQAPTELLDQDWDEAHAYNQRRTSNSINDAWNSRDDESSPEYLRYLEYLSQLSGTDAMARIIIPSINSDLPVYHGTSESTLARGAGHLFGTDLPVGGEGKHAVISAHTGMQSATLWDNLVDVKEGQAFYVQVAGHKLKYVVDQVSVVKPEETEALRRVEGRDLITLVTCTPYGINDHRLLVRGYQVPLEAGEEAVFHESHALNIQWWMWAVLGFSLLVFSGLVLWLRRFSPKGEHNTQPSIEKNNIEEEMQ